MESSERGFDVRRFVERGDDDRDGGREGVGDGDLYQNMSFMQKTDPPALRYSSVSISTGV
jgi:hypothetical protein